MLDSNLFTLLLRLRAAPSRILDLVEDGLSGNIAYSVTETPGDYAGQLTLFDSYTESVHATLTLVSPKLRTVELLNPSQSPIEIITGRGLSWERSFLWEAHRWSWSKDVVSVTSRERGYTLSLVNSPDPNWPVLVYRPANGKKEACIQMLDYNLGRLDVPLKDRRGWEILACLSLVSFIEGVLGPSMDGAPKDLPAPLLEKETKEVVPATPSPFEAIGRRLSALSVSAPSPPTPPRPVPPPPKPLHSVNEILVEQESREAEYEARALKLLEDESLLYLVIIARDAALQTVTVRMGEAVKRKRYKQSGEELQTYLDMEPGGSLKIYLSRIPLDELLPHYKSKIARAPRPPIILSGKPVKGGKIPKSEPGKSRK